MTADQQIRDVLKEIEASFSRLDIDAWFGCFHNPSLFVAPRAVVALSSAEQARELLGPEVERLRECGFARTQLDKCQVQLLTETTAVASTAWTRFDRDDKVIERLGATYVFCKTAEAWRAAMATSHNADLMVIP